MSDDDNAGSGDTWERLDTLQDAGIYESESYQGLSRLISLGHRVTTVPEVFVALVDDGRQVVKATAGQGVPTLAEYEMTDSLFQRAVDRRRSLWVESASVDGWDHRDPVCSRGGFEALAILPMFDSKDRPLGAFYAADVESRAWSDFERDVLDALAQSALTEIELRAEIARRERIEERLRWEAIRDPLTGLANRRLLWNRLEHAIDRAERTGAALGVLYVDLDNFKSINDTYGHSFGDELLSRMAERLEEEVRDQDTVSRLGGDEFVLLLENVGSRQQVRMAAGRVHDIFQEPFEVDGVEVRCEASLGYVTTQPAGEEEVASEIAEPEELVEMADHAMYRAKRRDESIVEVGDAPDDPG